MSSSPANLEVATDHHLFGSDVASDESEAAPDDTTAQPPSVEGASGIDDNTAQSPSVEGASGINDDSTAQPPSAKGASGIQEFIENDNYVSPDKRMTYTFMLAHQNIEGFSPKDSEPRAGYFDKQGHKSKFRMAKKMTCQEMKRRSPSLRLNASNTTVDQLMNKLAVFEDERDKRYVTDKEKNEDW